MDKRKIVNQEVNRYLKDEKMQMHRQLTVVVLGNVITNNSFKI
jgi:hypothetical protein